MRLFEGTEFYQPPRCDQCNELEESCQCPSPEPQPLPPQTQRARIRVETRKRGKVVTVVQGLAEGNPGRHYDELLSQLKNICGAGGSIQNDCIEIQGNHQQRLENTLKEIGYRIGQ